MAFQEVQVLCSGIENVLNYCLTCTVCDACTHMAAHYT